MSNIQYVDELQNNMLEIKFGLFTAYKQKKGVWRCETILPKVVTLFVVTNLDEGIP